MTDTTGTPGDAEKQEWTAWAVAPGFEVAGNSPTISLCQIDPKNFLVPTTFRFVGEGALADIRERLRRDLDDDAADQLLDDAREFPADSEQTDLASIPAYLTWFENKYGAHTLAAIIHDRLIRSGEPNLGALRNDALADRFFRLMMRTSGVPFFKSWVMWAAVAMRTRWAGGGTRAISVVAWGLLATIGITMFVSWLGTVLFDWGDLVGLPPGVRLAIALIMPFASAPLWGKQFGASLVAAIAALWILPPAAFAFIGYGVYRLLEAGARPFVRDN